MKAAALSQTVGYEALSLQQLADGLGIRKASIFHYFASKDDLACALIENDMQQFKEWSLTVANEPPCQRLTSYFSHYRQMLQDGQVCPGGAFAVSWPLLAGKVRDVLVSMRKQQLAFLEDLIGDGLRDGSFDPQAVTSDIIKSIPDMLQGAIQVARAGESVVPINRMERLIKALLGIHQN
jgi:TetR/AcrR family transcriptional repressor of nem operon